MSGHSEWTPASQPVISSPAASCEQSIHLQSYAIGFPVSVLPFVDRLYSTSCVGSRKGQCVGVAEVALGRAVLINGTAWLHALSRNMTLRSLGNEPDRDGGGDVAVFCEMYRRYNPVHNNPVRSEVDLCAAVFVKHGGVVFRVIPDSVTVQLSQLTAHQAPNRRHLGDGAISRITAASNGTCQFLTL
mmetsp:Transcript_25354/g.29476  ORF Transcript_25354/g.29476 Transcript_25354/m.29476 type:complete len:187 (+) Transcript_25354:1-561(+)